MDKKNEVRRYNFIVGQRLIYSGLFLKEGFWGGILLRTKIQTMRIDISLKYKIPLRLIKVSNTIKG